MNKLSNFLDKKIQDLRKLYFKRTMEVTMTIEGYYYLHTNGDLIYKKNLDTTVADIRDSDFAVGLWPFDPMNRENAWALLVEALASGANKERVLELAGKWGCTEDDAAVYADRLSLIVSQDGNKVCATRQDFTNLQECPVGFGDTLLEAMANLCEDLEYAPSKMWGTTFRELATS